MAATTILEARYVDRAKLDGLLRSAFGEGGYAVKVAPLSMNRFGISLILYKSQNEYLAVTASRQLTQVRISRLSIHWGCLTLTRIPYRVRLNPSLPIDRPFIGLQRYSSSWLTDENTNSMVLVLRDMLAEGNLRR